VNKTEYNIGLPETVGELIGENQDFSESECTAITLVLKLNAHGEPFKQFHTWLTLMKKLKLLNND